MKIEVDYINSIEMDDKERTVLRKSGETAFYEKKLLIKSDREIITLMLRSDNKDKLKIIKSVEKKKVKG